MRFITQLILFFILLIKFNLNVFSQEKIHVYTKHEEKAFQFNQSNELEINAENAQIEITGHQKETIEIKISLISRNQNKEIAKKELNYQEAYIHKQFQKIHASNYIIFSSDEKEISSNLMAKYEIKIPAGNSKIIINAKLGKININNVNGTMAFYTEYYDYALKNVSGSIRLNNKFGNVICENCNTKGEYILNYTKINFVNIKGDNKISNRSGSITIQPNEEFKSLVVNSKNTNITLFNKSCNEYNLKLKSYLGSVYISENCYLKNIDKIKYDTRNKATDKVEFFYDGDNNKGTIDITSHYGDINIQ